MSNTGSGLGKVILLGEHFVVYNLPGIVSSLENKTIATIEKSQGFELVDLRPKIKNFKNLKNFEYKKLIETIFNICNISLDNYKITLSGDLIVSSGGIGASAATAVSVTRALNNYLKLNLLDSQVNNIAFQAEKSVHGTPSGIDNTASVYGGSFIFEKTLNNNLNFIQLNLNKSLNIVLIDSNISCDTKKNIEQVKNFKDKNTEKFNKILNNYLLIFNQARESLYNFNLQKLGDLLTKNQDLLKELDLSCDSVDKIINLSLSFGALGAKLTGSGKGGLVIALTPEKELQDLVCQNFLNLGFEAFKTTLNL